MLLIAGLTGIAIALLVIGRGLFAVTTPSPWLSHANNAQHTGLSGNSSQSLTKVHWQTPVDLHPQYNGG
ncbi:MAG: hypothetical protein ACTHMB_29035, partial [Candidatus Binatia bacterium]